MFSQTHNLLIDSIFSLRGWCRENLPTENSLIAYDIVLILAIHNYSKSTITVKQLFSSVPYSYTAIRKHYQRLLADDWIELYSDTVDKRIKFVRPTTKFVSTMNQYAETINDLFNHQT